MANFINVYIIITFIWFLLSRIKQNILFYILFITMLNIVVSEVLLFYDNQIKFVTNLYFLFTFPLWLFLIVQELNVKYKKLIYLMFGIGASTTFYVYNIYTIFNKMFVVVSSILYVLGFLFLGFQKLINEDLQFFKRPKFVLLSAPVIFFLGMSVLLGFQDPMLSRYKLWDNFTLWQFINVSCNLVFYTFVNVYIYKAKKNK